MRILIIILLLLCTFSCKQDYQPPALKTNPGYLVVEGIINCKAGDTTTFKLSRTRGVTDSNLTSAPELNAHMTIVGSAGDTYQLNDRGNGNYVSGPLSLNQNENYQIKITTSNGSQYISDTVAVHPAPPIDSLTWYQDDSAGDVHVRINTHDPTAKSIYYRWYYTDLWEYHAPWYSELVLINGRIAYADTNTSTYTCWRGGNSSDILLGNTSALGQDRVNQAQIAVIPRGSNKISVRYSMLATSYVLSQPAYNYWQVIQKNNQNLGSLFDPQPSQIYGNYHCVTNPKETVIGFLSASTLQQLRFFIPNSQVHNWDTAGTECTTIQSYRDPNDFTIYHYADTNYAPLYFSGDALFVTKKTCNDCRAQGGTTQRPSFW